MDLTFRSAVPYYYIFLAVLGAAAVVTYAMQRSRFGYYLRAIRAGERAARSLGVPVRLTKLYALMLSAAFTSLRARSMPSRSASSIRTAASAFSSRCR